MSLEMLNDLPEFDDQKNNPDPVVHCCFRSNQCSSRWYAISWYRRPDVIWGYVEKQGEEGKLDYFTSIKVCGDTGIKPDKTFKPCKLSELNKLT